MSGKNVPHATTKAMLTSTTLLSTKTASREYSDSSRAGVRSRSWRVMSSTAQVASSATMKTRKGTPSVEAPKAWMDSRMPERTRKVPSTASTPVPIARDTFQAFSVPRFSWIVSECSAAVPVSHGSSAAFSTASHAQ
jgi:hypothetical protein